MTIYENIDAWDMREWSRVLDRNANLQSTERRLDDKAPDGGAILHDVYWGLYKGDPRVKKNDDIPGNHRWMKKVMDSLKETNEWTELRSRCKLNPIEAESATSQIIKTLEPMVPNLHKESDNQPLNQQAKTKAQALLSMLDDDDDIGEPAPSDPGMALRKAMRQAAKEALDEMDAIDDAMYGMGFGEGDGKSTITSGATKLKLAQLLRENPQLRKIAELAGKLRRIATRTQKSKPKHGTDEIHSVTVGDDLARLIPVEMAYLNHPELKLDFIRRLVEKQVQQYELKGTEREAKGPIIFCVDESSSMNALGPDGVKRDVWAKASMLAIANIAREQKRRLTVIHFSDGVSQIDHFEPGKYDFIDLVECALHFAGGGTNFVDPLEQAKVEVTRSDRKEADIIFITDDACHLYDDFIKDFNTWKEETDTHCYGLPVMGKGATVLSKFCDEVAPVHGMTNKSKATDLMFSI